MNYGNLGNLFVSRPPRRGVTISAHIGKEGPFWATYFSLGEGTSISKESYPHPSLYLGLGGEVFLEDKGRIPLAPGSLYLRSTHEPFGESTITGGSYLEIDIGKEENVMIKNIEAGKPFILKELVPVEEGSIVNLDLLQSKGGKFALMAFDKGESLAPHRAPGEALLFALEGEAEFAYEGKTYQLHEGEIFHMAKNGLHALKALTPFKMALLLSLGEEE